MHCCHLLRHETVPFLSFISIIIPAANLKDLEKIPSELKKDVQFYPVKEIKEVLEIALPGVLDKAVAKI